MRVALVLEKLWFENVFKFLRLEERFGKAPFSWRISVDGWPNGRINAVFSNSPDVVFRCLKQAHKLTQASELLKGVR